MSWSAAQERQLVGIDKMIRLAYKVLPDRFTYFPLAYHARKHHQCLEKMAEDLLAPSIAVAIKSVVSLPITCTGPETY